MTPPTQLPGFNPDGTYNSRPRPRPRFDLTLEQPPERVLGTIRDALEQCDNVHGLILEDGGKIELTLVQERVKIWSPQLSALASANEAGGTSLKARFGPHPHVWGLFLAGYAMGIMLTCASFLFGMVQLFLDMSPWALWFTPVALLVTALTYGAAYVGQGLGAGQMHDLRAFLDGALDMLEEEPAG